MSASQATRWTTLLSTTAAVVALSAVVAAPASASNSYNGAAYIQGGGAFGDDWGDEGILSTRTNAKSNATCLWQKILWADGKLAWAQIDGVFGPTTYAATKAWQDTFGLPVDGIVGKKTFAKAGKWLLDSNDNGAVDTYIGLKNHFTVSRGADGRYGFYDDGVKRSAGYNYLTCS